MALHHGGIKRERMADELGVDPATITRWMGDKGAPPRAAYVKQWALLTKVEYPWLATGQMSNPRPENDPDGGEGLPRLDSNQQPAG